MAGLIDVRVPGHMSPHQEASNPVNVLVSGGLKADSSKLSRKELHRPRVYFMLCIIGRNK